MGESGHKKNAFPYRENVLSFAVVAQLSKRVRWKTRERWVAISASGKFRAGGQAVLRAGRQAVAGGCQSGNTHQNGNHLGHVYFFLPFVGNFGARIILFFFELSTPFLRKITVFF